MREIKFRAWDKTKKRMAEVTDFHPECHDMAEMVVVRDETGESVDTLFDNYVVMQCTGLKDKNGKEIFEGDILSKTSVWGALDVCWIGYGWYDGASYIEREIIGNIYEHTNLLTNEK